VTRRGWVLFAVMAVVWGIPYLMIKVAVGSVSVPMVVFARTTGGALLLLPLALRAGDLRAVLRHWRPLLAFACLEIMVPWALLSDAERHLSSSMTGLLVAAVPITGVVVARLTGGSERVGATRWLGLVVGLLGVAVLAVPHLGGGSGWSVAEVLLVAVCYASAPLIATRKLAAVSSLQLTATCLTLAAIAYTPAAIATWPSQVPPGRVLAALAGLAVVCTAFAFLVFFSLIREVGPSRAMVFTYVNPAVAVAAGVVVLGEPLSLEIVASFALILCGSVLATAKPRQLAAVPATVAAAQVPADARSGERPLPEAR
jgi:drug/metabolite transporter (DMT)-like permease